MAIFEPAHPGIILGEDILKELNITITDGANRLGVSRKTLSLVVNGKARIQADLAVKLESAFRGACKITKSKEYSLAKAAKF